MHQTGYFLRILHPAIIAISKGRCRPAATRRVGPNKDKRGESDGVFSSPSNLCDGGVSGDDK